MKLKNNINNFTRNLKNIINLAMHIKLFTVFLLTKIACCLLVGELRRLKKYSKTSQLIIGSVSGCINSFFR